MYTAMKKICEFLVFLLIVFFPLSVFSAVPGLMNYQGRLTDDAGASVADATYQVRFALFNAETAGYQLWNAPATYGEEQSVNVTGGIYNVQLGAVVPLNVPLGMAIFAGDTVWLEVTIYNTDTSSWETMSPRQRLTSGGYAFQAENSDMLEGNTVSALDMRYVNVGEAGVVTSSMIVDNEIGADDLAADSVGSSEIATGAVGSSEIVDNSLTASDLAANSVGSSEIVNNSLTASDLAANSVGASELASNSVGSAEIINGAVSAADLQDGAVLTEILDDDGSGSLLNADFLDGYSSSYFMKSSHLDYGRSGVSVNLYEGSSTLTSKYVNETGDSMSGPLDVAIFTNHPFALSGANDYDTYGYLGIQGDDDFDGTTTADWNGQEIGVAGISTGTATPSDNFGIKGHSNGVGVRGEYSGDPANNYGDLGKNGYGVYGKGIDYGGYFEATDSTAYGVYGKASNSGSGLKYGGYFECDSTTGYGVYAKVNGSFTNYAVRGEGTGTGSSGAWFSTTSRGYDAIFATATSTTGTTLPDDSAGGRFISAAVDGFGVHARANGTNGTGVHAQGGLYGPGIYARGGSNGYAAIFSGNVKITNRSTGAIVMELGEGLDYAEGFDVSSYIKPEPGAVLIIDPDNPGKLKLSENGYDTKVAGIVAGANGMGSGVRLGGNRFDNDVALAGRVFCMVDATSSAVKTGDLLTTSDLPGHAMKATDYNRAQGAILGKAMQNLEQGKMGKILVLVTLQ